MRDMLKPFFLIGGLFCVALIPAHADNAPAPSDAPASSVPDTAPSILDHLQMRDSQVERLDKVLDRYSPIRGKQERTLDDEHRDLDKAQDPKNSDPRWADELKRDIVQTHQEMSEDFQSAHRDALKILTPVQRSLLESLANDLRIRIRENSYYLLLVAPADAPWPMADDAPPPPRDRPEHHRNNGNGRYGVYGGYGYGRPQYGVYGGVGQGPVGVYGGVGRGGPSIGVGVGGIFGMGRYLP